MKRLIGVLAILVFWELYSRMSGSVVIVPFLSVLEGMWKLIWSGEAFGHIAASMGRIFPGFLIASSLGFVSALLITEFHLFDMAVMPIVDSVRPVAALSIFPVIILLMGIGELSKIFVIFWTAWPAVLLNTVHGIRTVDRQIVEASMLDGADRFQILRHISVPLSMPTIVTGLRIGLSGGFISLVAAEMLGSNSGLGYAVWKYSNTFHYAEMFACIILIALIGLAFNVILAAVQKHFDLQNGESPFLRYGDRAASYSTEMR